MNDQEIKKRFEAIENRLAVLEGTDVKKVKLKQNSGYREGSTAHKLIILKDEGFFNNAQRISQIVDELKSKDYHLKASDLTLPLRNLVRSGVLKKTKNNSDGSESKNWMYIKK